MSAVGVTENFIMTLLSKMLFNLEKYYKQLIFVD